MQEEIEHKTVNLAISTTKLSARTLLRGMQFLLRQYDKHASQGKQAEEDAKKAAEEAVASGSEQTGGNKVTKYAATFLGVLALVGLVAGGGIYTFMKQKQKKQAEKEALDPDANYTEDKGDFEIPVEDEPEETGEEDNAEE